jgi:hypothetical protein
MLSSTFIDELGYLPDRTGWLWLKSRSPEAIKIRTRTMTIPEGRAFRERVEWIRGEAGIGSRTPRAAHLAAMARRDAEWLKDGETDAAETLPRSFPGDRLSGGQGGLTSRDIGGADAIDRSRPEGARASGGGEVALDRPGGCALLPGSVPHHALPQAPPHAPRALHPFGTGKSHDGGPAHIGRAGTRGDCRAGRRAPDEGGAFPAREQAALSGDQRRSAAFRNFAPPSFRCINFIGAFQAGNMRR